MYFRILLSVVVFALFSPATASAEPSSKQLEAAKQIVLNGNDRGAAACASCHEEDGRGQSRPVNPRLAGLSAHYLKAQLDAFAERKRSNDLMHSIAAALTPAQRSQVAAYYASLPPKGGQPSVAEDPGVAQTGVGQRLAELGKWERDVPACVRCHGANGQGVPPHFPPLAGQYKNYLRDQLRAFKDGDRTNDPMGLMREVAQSLSDEEIEAVAAYFAALPAGPERAAGEERLRQAAQWDAADKKDLLAQYEESVRDGYRPPPELNIPDDQFGQSVLQGKKIFADTPRFAGPYVGNGLSCVNCHLDRGRRDASAPMGPAYVRYPKYRSKNDQINTMVHRIQGCFKYSENGTPPEPLSPEMTALISYFHWLSTGAPSNVKLEQAGFPKVEKPPKEYDPQRGAVVYANHCALCHGAQGEGTRLENGYQFPPLWGKQSFNWGAGMHRVNTAAAFIQHNMPLGRPSSLSVQEAWDVAAFINAHERPQDPRFSGDVSRLKKQHHDHPCFYGESPLGESLDGT